MQPKSRLNFYSTENLLAEIEEHSDKLKKLSKYSDYELHRVIQILTSKIRFINVNLIPKKFYSKAELLTNGVDLDDTEFVALTDHVRGRLWSGDKELIAGLRKRKWDKFISTDELHKFSSNRN